jgi:2-dehydro-3-deoxyphosphogluconate aldolase/(4S)-4-hydroxy-2-oxoglutarate aldolase
VPTGGVSLTTAGDFLKAGASAVAVGGELIDGKTIREGEYGVFTERAKKFLEVIQTARAEMKG